jgi:glycosyltransferase involved in cell wall biosynthesis
MTDCAHGIGGMQRHTHDLVRGLTGLGHTVDVICPAHETLDPSAYGATWHLVDTPGRTDKGWYRKYRETFLALDRSAPFDVVHSESTAAHGLLFKPAVRTPIVVKYHGNYLSLLKAHFRRVVRRPSSAPGEAKGLLFMTRDYLTRGNAWIFRSCVSMAPSHEQARDTAISQLIPRGLMHPVPNGIDTDTYRPRDRQALRQKLELPGGTLFVTAGRLNKEKGFDIALEALARVTRDHPEARLLILGDGDQRGPLEAFAKRLGVAEHALFLGGQAPDRVAEYMAASDVFLFPTRRHEAGPIVLLEGMACGLPTIATKIGGNTEVVEPPDGEPAGLLTRLASVSDLERAMRRLLTDPALADRLGRRARSRILEEYTVELMIERTVAVYRLAIARSAVAAT